MAFEEIVLISGITIAVSLPLIGWASDRLPPFAMIIVSFISRGCLFGLFYYA